MNQSDKSDISNSIKEYFKKWPRSYYFVSDFFGPMYFGGLNPKKFLLKFGNNNNKTVNLGSGARKIADGVTNVDMTKYKGVDVVASLCNLPFQDNTFDRVICDQVFEHLEFPDQASEEIYRILNTNGVAYISTPFLYPFHSSPADYQRWTKQGLDKLFRKFEILEVGVRSGPFSVITVYMSYIGASIFSFGSDKLYWILVYMFNFIFFPIKFIDVLANKLPFIINCSSCLYCVIKKIK